MSRPLSICAAQSCATCTHLLINEVDPGRSEQGLLLANAVLRSDHG